jgi:hypothetical protein
MGAKERRREERIAWRGDVRLIVDGAAPMPATIADISEIGCGFSTSSALDAGSAVCIDGEGFHGNGVVRYCYALHGGYRIGVELLPPG